MSVLPPISPLCPWKDILLVLSTSIAVVWPCAFSLVSRARHSTVYEFFARLSLYYGKRSPNELQYVLLHAQDVNSSWRDCTTYIPTKVFYCNELFFWHAALFGYKGVYGDQCTGHTHTASIHRCWLIDNSVHCCSHAPANRPALTAVWIRSWHSALHLDDETVVSCHTMLVYRALHVASSYRTGMTYIVCMTESRQPFTWFAR